jgi:hypothetical protein
VAQKVQILLEDDLDGSPATETIPFALDGKAYEIDLNEKNAVKLRTSLQKFVSAARSTRQVGASGKKKTVTQLGPSAREIRDWAHSNGHPVPDRGRIPGPVRDAFLAAH